MQTYGLSQRGLVAQNGLSRQQRGPQRQQHLVAFTGFRRAGAVDSLGSKAPKSLHAAVRKAITSAAGKSGVKCVRLTRMMFERFTEKAIKVVMLAQEEARRLGHNFVGTEQILLGLIGESTGMYHYKMTPQHVFVGI
jgi:ATP-dependent Clp protease ATP-binding subunit ClpA